MVTISRVPKARRAIRSDILLRPTRMTTVRLGSYALGLRQSGEILLLGRAATGRLDYSDSLIRHGAFRLFMPLPARYDHFVNATDFTRIKTLKDKRSLTVKFRRPIIDGVLYD